jgi:hypothetical protein
LLNVATQPGQDRNLAVGIRTSRVDQLSVTGNVIRGLATSALSGAGRAGLQIVALTPSSSVRIEGNQLVDIGPDEFGGLWMGIDCLGTFDDINIRNNSVRRRQNQPELADSSTWFAVRFLGSSTPGVRSPDDLAPDLRRFIETRPTLVDLSSGAAFVPFSENLVLVLEDRVLVLPRGRERVAICGNDCLAFGDAPCVVATGAGAFVFGENKCTLLAARSTPAAVVGGGAIVANANYIQGAPDSPGLILQRAEEAPVTVVANIASGIQLDGAPLGAPWAPLNAIAT